MTKHIKQKPTALIKNIVLLTIVVLLGALPLVFVKGGEFGGADGQARAAIGEINKDYKPWFTSVFKPASGEVESLLFALQAAIGSGVLFFGLGYMVGRAKTEARYEARHSERETCISDETEIPEKEGPC